MVRKLRLKDVRTQVKISLARLAAQTIFTVACVDAMVIIQGIAKLEIAFVAIVALYPSRLLLGMILFVSSKKSFCSRIQASHQQQRPVTSFCCVSEPWGCTASVRHRFSFKHRWKNRILLGYTLLTQFLVPCPRYPGQGPDFTFVH